MRRRDPIWCGDRRCGRASYNPSIPISECTDNLIFNIFGCAMADAEIETRFVELAAEIVSSYVTKNAVPTHELPQLIADVHGALQKTVAGEAEPEPEPLKPAVPIKKSITPDFLICLEDGKKFKSLKRHLRTHYDLSPEEYRQRWGLPSDYPMVAPNYAAARSELAKRMGLGQQRKAAAKPPAKKPTRARKSEGAEESCCERSG